MSLSCCISMLMLFLSLSPVGCSCSFFSICHFSYLQFSYPYMSCSLPVPLSIPDVIILMLSNFNLSQMLEFDEFWKLVATSLLQVLSKTKKTFPQFSFPFSGAWRILPSSNYGLPIVQWKFSVRISFFVLILRSWMSPHVMYGSAGCVSKS